MTMVPTTSANLSSRYPGTSHCDDGAECNMMNVGVSFRVSRGSKPIWWMTKRTVMKGNKTAPHLCSRKYLRKGGDMSSRDIYKGLVEALCRLEGWTYLMDMGVRGKKSEDQEGDSASV